MERKRSESWRRAPTNWLRRYQLELRSLIFHDSQYFLFFAGLASLELSRNKLILQIKRQQLISKLRGSFPRILSHAQLHPLEGEGSLQLHRMEKTFWQWKEGWLASWPLLVGIHAMVPCKVKVGGSCQRRTDSLQSHSPAVSTTPIPWCVYFVSVATRVSSPWGKSGIQGSNTGIFSDSRLMGSQFWNCPCPWYYQEN